MNALKRFWHWLRNPEYPPVGVPYETVVLLRNESYELGLAQGEIIGRKLLADEIAVIHGVDGGNQALGFEAARIIKSRQVH